MTVSAVLLFNRTQWAQLLVRLQTLCVVHMIFRRHEQSLKPRQRGVHYFGLQKPGDSKEGRS